MANDHYVARGYLRGFTPEYARNYGVGGQLYRYSAVRPFAKVGIKQIASEEGLYAGHKMDTLVQRFLESGWPKLRTRLGRYDLAAETKIDLILFMLAQSLRTPTALNRLAHSLRARTGITGALTMETGTVLNLAMKVILDTAPRILDAFEWEVVHVAKGAPDHDFFITSDNPVALSPDDEVAFPLAFNMALRGRPTKSEEGFFGHRKATRSDFVIVNRSVVYGCTEEIYSHRGMPEIGSFFRCNYAERPAHFTKRAFAPSAVSA